jgi:hypothetical protein
MNRLRQKQQAIGHGGAPAAWVASIMVNSVVEAIPRKASDKEPLSKPLSICQYRGAVNGWRCWARDSSLRRVVNKGTRSFNVDAKS